MLQLFTMWLLALLLPLGEALRRSSPLAKGQVDELYTFGAPGWATPEPKGVQDTCFPGLRVISEFVRPWWVGPSTVDAVPVTTYWSGLSHFKMDIGLVDLRSGAAQTWNFTQCSDRTYVDPRGNPSPNIHFPSQYDETAFGKMPERASMMMRFARMAYKEDATEVKEGIRPYGWELAGTAKSQTDWFQVSHLVQHPESLECAVLFHGTEDGADWIQNFRVSPVGFCGLIKPDEVCNGYLTCDRPPSGGSFVHEGFRDQLRRMVQNPEWQANIKPHLPYCSKLFISGHSMGGAMAELMAACLTTAPKQGEYGYEEDYKWMGFSKLSPKKLSYL